MVCYGTIYKITNKVTGQMYIGQTTVGLSQRWKEHVHYARRNRRPTGAYLASSIIKYGPKSFIIESVCSVLHSDYLDELEEELISAY